ncbi:MAG: hypothetical protein A2078_02225 [Nitrospirae bacterium GWC2_57_9]|nr:MAG: hypothetical protein A2078_02225 [Nitrospirae bacterium GWC2_57_9]
MQRTGEYEIVNPGDDIFVPDMPRLWHADGILFVQYYLFLPDKTPIMVALSPVSDDEAVIKGLGRGMGETVRAVTIDGREMLSYSGYVFRKKTEMSAWNSNDFSGR